MNRQTTDRNELRERVADKIKQIPDDIRNAKPGEDIVVFYMRAGGQEEAYGFRVGQFENDYHSFRILAGRAEQAFTQALMNDFMERDGGEGRG